MNFRAFIGKLLRSIPFLVYQSSRFFIWKSPSDTPPSPETLIQVERILVVRLDAIGDFLMTTPALRSLRKRFPFAQVDLLVQPSVVPVAEHILGIHRLYTLPCGFLLRLLRPVQGVTKWLSTLWELRRRNYDLVLDMTGLFHSAAAARMTGAPLRFGFRRSIPMGFFQATEISGWYSHILPWDDSAHIADQMLQFPLALGGERDNGGWEPICSTDFERSAVAALEAAGVDLENSPLAVIHPGGKWPPKRWSAQNFSRAIDILQEKKIQVVVLAGPGEESLIQEIRRNCQSQPAFLWPPEPLLTTYGILQLADIFIGNDSGPMHMAASSGTPGVALFGPAPPKRCAPRGGEIIPFYADLECSPCPMYFSKDHCHRGHNYCMDEWDPAEIAEAALRLIPIGDVPRRRSSAPASSPSA